MSILAVGRDAGLGLVRGRACLRQRALAAGADRHRHAPRERPTYVEAGLRSLRWLMTLQTTPAGHFRPVGTRGLRRQRQHAAARSISSRWKPRRRSRPALRHGAPMAIPNGKPIATRVFAWFLGSNDLSLAAGRSRDRQLPRWAASRPRQREPRRRVGRVLSSRPRGNPSARAACSDSADEPAALRAVRRLSSRTPLQRAEGTLSQATFLNRQALYLRPDPARVVVRPFKPATEPRDLNPTDKTRANHIVDRVLALDPEAAASQLADVLENFQGRHRNLLETFEARADEMEEAFAPHVRFHQGPAPAGRRLFSARIFVRSLGAVQSEHRLASRSVRRAGRRPALHPQSSRRRRRARLLADVSLRNHRGRRQRDRRSDGAACVNSPK